MGTKYELLSVIFSDVGFRNNRKCKYRIRVRIGSRYQHIHFATFKEVLKCLKLLCRPME